MKTTKTEKDFGTTDVVKVWWNRCILSQEEKDRLAQSWVDMEQTSEKVRERLNRMNPNPFSFSLMLEGSNSGCLDIFAPKKYNFFHNQTIEKIQEVIGKETFFIISKEGSRLRIRVTVSGREQVALSPKEIEKSF
jgi:hypothetical protein